MQACQVFPSCGFVKRFSCGLTAKVLVRWPSGGKQEVASLFFVLHGQLCQSASGGGGFDSRPASASLR